jgi:AcrR family transcriptional regulator
MSSRPAPATEPLRGRRPGRPREGETGREEILDAAAELFCQQGYAATSTRAVALAVGIKQASLYYHFPSKEAVLADLLAGTVTPSIRAAENLERLPGRAAARLHALATFDVGLLCSGRWNLASLYLLPELRQPRFASFQADRARLRAAYGRTVAAAVAEGDARPDDVDLATALVFGLVESVISVRGDREQGADLTDLVATVPTAALRMLGVPANRLTAVRRESTRMVAALDAGQD